MSHSRVGKPWNASSQRSFGGMCHETRVQELAYWTKTSRLDDQKLIEDEHYWDRTYSMLRALYGPYQVLRLCDTQAAVMDKVYYFASKTLEDLKDKNDDFKKWKLSVNMKEAMMAITKKSKDNIQKRAEKYSYA
jgi:hypothetical protein